jgi:hypothetical protein
LEPTTSYRVVTILSTFSPLSLLCQLTAINARHHVE